MCGPVENPAGANDIGVNPKLIVEVLPNSTKNYDRGEKFRHYRSVPGSLEYLLVAQDSVRVEQHVLQTDGSWVFREFTTHTRIYNSTRSAAFLTQTPSMKASISLRVELSFP